MTFYAWTISKPGREDIKEVTTLPELQDVLWVLNLLNVDQTIPDHGTYTNDEGTIDEWKLTWTKIDGATEVLD
jgi:hypothetical protein